MESASLTPHIQQLLLAPHRPVPWSRSEGYFPLTEFLPFKNCGHQAKAILLFYQDLLLSTSSVLIRFLVQLRADTQLPVRTGSSRAPISLCINKLILLFPGLY